MSSKIMLPSSPRFAWRELLHRGVEFTAGPTYFYLRAQQSAHPRNPRLEISVAMLTVRLARVLIAHYPKTLLKYDFRGKELNPDRKITVNLVFTGDKHYRGVGSGSLGSAKAFWVGYTDPAFRRLYRYPDGTWFYQGYWVDGVGTLAHELHHAWGGHHEFQGEFFTPVVWALVHARLGWKLVPARWREDLWLEFQARTRVKGQIRAAKQALKLLEEGYGL